MLKLKRISTNEIIESSDVPTFSRGMWDCGNLKFMDFNKTLYEVVEVPNLSELSISPIRFKILFTAAQRIAIKTSVDPIVQDFFDLIEDPRLDSVILPLPCTVAALSYLVSINILTEQDKNRILSNQLPS